MRVLVAGAAGQLGGDLRERAPESAALEWIAPEESEFDITDAAAVDRVVGDVRPSVLINAAAYTAVDRAEEDVERAHAINALGPAHLARAAARVGAALVQVSTDYVFDGTLARPYRENDPPNPLGSYGATKLAGEEEVRRHLDEHVILRVSWLFGCHGHNFVATIRRLARERVELRIVADQWGRPTPSWDLAGAIGSLCQAVAAGDEIPWGTYHYGGAPVTTWHGFAETIVAALRRREPVAAEAVHPISTSDFRTPARRPLRSVLDCAKFTATFGGSLPSWERGLERVIDRWLRAENSAH